MRTMTTIITTISKGYTVATASTNFRANAWDDWIMEIRANDIAKTLDGSVAKREYLTSNGVIQRVEYRVRVP